MEDDSILRTSNQTSTTVTKDLIKKFHDQIIDPRVKSQGAVTAQGQKQRRNRVTLENIHRNKEYAEKMKKLLERQH